MQMQCRKLGLVHGRFPLHVPIGGVLQGGEQTFFS